MDCSLPGSSVHGIFQARILEWVAIFFSRRSSPPRDWTQVSCIVGRHFTIWAFREVSHHSLRQCTKSCLTLATPWTVACQGSSVYGILQARILEWVAISFSGGSSRPRNRTQVSSIAGRFSTNWGGGGCKNKKANRTGWTKSGMIKINGGSNWIHFAMAPQPSQALNNHMRF